MARRVVIEVVGDTTDVERKLEGLKGQAKQTGDDASRSMERASAGTKKWESAIKLATAGAAGLAAGVAAVGAAAISTAADIDSLTKTARGLGATAGELQTIERALGLSGLAAEETDALVQRLTRSLGDAATKGGPAADALRELGLSGEALSRLSLADQVTEVVVALSTLEDVGVRASVAQELLGRQSRSLLSALAQGEDALRANFDAVRSLGTVTQEQAEEAEALTDSVALLTGTLEQLKMDALSPIIPVLDDQIDRFRRLIDLVRKYSGITNEATGEVDRLEQRQRMVAEATAEYERRLAEQTLRLAQGTSTAEQMAHSEREVQQALEDVLRAEELLRAAQGALNDEQERAAGAASAGAEALDEQAEASKRDERALRDLAKALAQTAAIEAEAQANAAKAARIAAGVKRQAYAESKAAAAAAAAAEIEAAQMAAEQVASIEQQAADQAKQSAMDVAGRVGDLLGAIADVEQRAQEERAANAEALGDRIERLQQRLTEAATSEEKDRIREQIAALRQREAAEKQAAREAFKRQQALSIIQTTIAGALAIVQAFAQLGPVAGGVAAGIVGAITGIQIGLIASQAPPFHLGGVVPPQAQSGAGEVPTRLLPGEGVVNRDGMQALGADGLNRLNRGESAGGGSMAAYFVFDGRVLAAAQAQNDRRGVVSSGSQRQRVGTARPVAYSR